MNEIMIPTLLFWENGNSWYGSKGLARFFIKPVKKESGDDTPDHTDLEIELWCGPLTRELSEILATTVFPLSEDGLAQTIQWLEGWATELNK